MAGDQATGAAAFRAPNFDHEDDSVVHALPEAEPRAEFLQPFEAPPRDDPGDDFHAQLEDIPEGETGFGAVKFQRENTLLTNADLYAASIRDEAELYVKQIREEVDLLNQEAEARYEEAARVKAQAEEEARQLAEQGQAEADRIRNEAYQEGFAQGEADGQAKRYEEAGPMLGRIESLLEVLSQFRKQVEFYAEKDSLRLALLLAKRVLHQEVRTNRKVVWNLLASLLAKFRGTGKFTVCLNDEDFRFATAARPALERFLEEGQELGFRADPNLSPGNVLIETDREVIDATFESQFHHIEGLLSQMIGEREAQAQRAEPSPAAPASAAPAASGDTPSATAPVGEDEDD
jgi:flagellar assembly protein FliH